MTDASQSWYQIRIKGHLDESWSAWFDDLTITHDVDGTTLHGPVIDQSALYGLLSRARDLGLILVAVTPWVVGARDDGVAPPTVKGGDALWVLYGARHVRLATRWAVVL